MTVPRRRTGDRCPYELASGSITGCPRFEPLVVVELPDGPILTCVHVRCSIARPDPDEGTEAMFYPRCVLRTGDPEAERAFVVPLD